MQGTDCWSFQLAMAYCFEDRVEDAFYVWLETCLLENTAE